MRTNRSSSQRFSYLFIAPLALLAVLAPGGLQANAQEVQLRPHAGLYLPTRISIQSRVLHVQQKIGVTVGARLTLTFNERLDVVTSVTYIPGYAMFRGAGEGMDVGTRSHLLTATTGARYWLLPPGRTLSWEVHTGLGVAFGGQPAYEDLFESSTVSGILGTTVRYQLAGSRASSCGFRTASTGSASAARPLAARSRPCKFPSGWAFCL